MASNNWRSWVANASGLVRSGYQLAEELLRQQPHVLGEEAKQEPDQEVGGAVGVFTPSAQNLREPGELPRRLLRDVLRGFGGAEGEGVSPDPPKLVKLAGIEEIVEREGGNPFDRVGEVGVYLYGL